MPLIKLDTSCDLGTEQKRAALTQGLSRIAAEAIGKPEQYVMACVQDKCTMSMGGKVGPCALVSVGSIGGLNHAVNEKLATAVCELLERELGLAGDRVYCVFDDRAATHWAWQGRPFG